MECPKCGACVKENDNFCEECGASLKLSAQKTGSSPGAYPKSKAVIYDSNLAAVTNIGRKHPTNEDSGTVLRLDNGYTVLIVSDGVSSSFSATSASQTAIEAIKAALSENGASTEDMIISSIHAADDCIKALPCETREDGIYGPEATVVMALVKDNASVIGWVGDSRAYIINKDCQKLITVDDSWVELVVAEGSMTREEALVDKRAHYVTQVLGMHDQGVDIHVTQYKLEAGDMLLLCSDGLWNYFQGENVILNTITAFGMNSDAGAICEHLVGLANSAGGHDNITAAMYRI